MGCWVAEATHRGYLEGHRRVKPLLEKRGFFWAGLFFYDSCPPFLALLSVNEAVLKGSETMNTKPPLPPQTDSVQTAAPASNANPFLNSPFPPELLNTGRRKWWP